MILGWVRRRIVASAVIVGPIHAQFPAHNLVVVEVAYGGGCCVGVGELCEAKALWSASFLVVDQAEVVDLPNATQCFDDELFRAACGDVLAMRLCCDQAHVP